MDVSVYVEVCLRKHFYANKCMCACVGVCGNVSAVFCGVFYETVLFSLLHQSLAYFGVIVHVEQRRCPLLVYHNHCAH